MEIVRPEDYQNQQTKYYLTSEKERQEMPLYQKVALGAAATAGLLAIGHRTGAFHELAKFLNTNVRLSLKAARDILSEEGALKNDLSLDRLKRVTSRYIERRKELLEIAEQQKDVFHQREYDMERYLRQRERLVGGYDPQTGTYTGDLAEHIDEGLRLQKIMEDIRAHDKINKTLADQIEIALGKGEVGDLKYASNDHIRYLLGNQNIKDDQIVKIVNDIRHQYRNVNFLKNHKISPDGEKWIRGMQQKMRAFTAEQIQSLTRKNGSIKQGIIGHRQATVQDILELHKQGAIKVNADLIAQINDVLKYNKSFKEAIFDENLYVKTRNGKIAGLMDYGVYKEIGRRTMEWWSHTLPGGLIHLRDILNVKAAREQASFRIMKRQSIQPMLNAHRGFDNKNPLNEMVVFVNGKFVKLFDADAINNDAPLKILNPKRDMYLTSSRFGTIAKISKHVAGIQTPEKKRNFITEALDLFNQDKDAGATEAYHFFTKFLNPDWTRNKINSALANGINTLEDYYFIKRYFAYNTEGLTPRTLNRLKEYMPSYIRDFIEKEKIDFNDQKDMLKLFEHLGADMSPKDNPEFYKLYQRYLRNPDELLGWRYPIGEKNVIIGGNVRIQTGFNQIEQEISKEIIRKIVQHDSYATRDLTTSQLNVKKLFDQLKDSGSILKSDYDKANRLFTQYLFEQAGQNLDTAMSRITDLFRGDGELEKYFQNSIQKMAKETNPIWEQYSPIKPYNPVGDEYIAVNKAFQSTTLTGRIAEFFTNFRDIALQLGLRTGRRNMEDFTTLSIFGGFYPAFRLQEALGGIGLGFSDASMGSPLQLWSSLMLKRIFPIFGAVGLYNYLDYEVDKWTGTGITERWENYKADERLQAAISREKFGTLDRLKHEQLLKPGIEQFNDMPSIHIPFIGEFGPGDLINSIASILSRTPITDYHREDLMTPEETVQDITEGSVPVRKGRWWAFGSKTPYVGDRILYFAPNSYRLAHSDWEHTNVTATGEEKYSHSWFPTLENPLGGLAYLLGLKDPYWWEKKHYYDRPYLLTGELFNSNTPFIGDIGNAILGRIIKPVRHMHEEYWGEPTLVYEETNQDTDNEKETPVVTRISPGGRIENVVPATAEDYGGENAPYESGTVIELPKSEHEKLLNERIGNTTEEDDSKKVYIVSERKTKKGKKTGDQIVKDAQTGEVIYLPRRLKDKYSSYDEAFRQARAGAINTKPRNLFAPEFEYQKQADRKKLEELKNPDHWSWRLQETAMNWAEPLGIFNWILVDELGGYDPYTGTMVIEKADKAYNISNAFWERNLGSLGGDLSEIGRRFIRKDSGFLETYNPVRNTMPDWLPGSDYFIDFKTGDPYSKIPFGEYRLPGEAYERLNPLHPDETGYYGAFDKFKILADVAPWSEEYKFWRDYVNEHITDPELRKQFAEIKRQVARRKKKYEFQEYRFKYADIDKVNVTVTKILDDKTFLTKEFGDTPIRLAGIDARSKFPGLLEEYFKPGDRITLGIDANENKRIENDTYHTMHAVVFMGLRNINQEIIRRGQLKESQSDFSPTGVWARFTPGEIAAGRRWEAVAHFESALNTKFLHVRSALEEYERDQIYGKDWATWENFGVSDYLIPAIERMAGNDSMLMAGMSGFFVGGFIGRIFLGGGHRTKWGALLGGAVGLLANAYGKYESYKQGERWIPKRRQIEQDINEYFDILKYLKFKGLYEKAKTELRHMGYDVDALLNEIEKKKEHIKQRKAELEEQKRRLYLKQPKNWEEKRKKINEQLDKLTLEWDEIRLPSPVLQALYYKDQMETTLYALDPHDDRLKIMAALPYKDKQFFNAFAEANPKEYKKILELVPENQRRFYEGIWGLKTEPRKPLEYYLEKYQIPGPDWEGWRPEYNLEDIKVKVVQKYHLDLSDFNFWNDDVVAAQYTPDINPNQDIYHKPPAFSGYRSLERNIRAIMEGQGLKNVQVVVRPSQNAQTRVHVRYEEDRRDEIDRYLKENANSLI